MSAVTQTTLDSFIQPVSFDNYQRHLLQVYLRRSARRRYWETFDRDDYECPVCGNDGPFEVHHRDADPFNNHPLNLIAVCEHCHRHEHRRRRTVERVADWKGRFADAMLGGS